MRGSFKIGLVFLTLRLLRFVASTTGLRPLGPYASDSQVTAIVLGMGSAGIGGLICLVCALVGLIRKTCRSDASNQSLFNDLLNFLGFLNLGELFQLAVPIELADQGRILAPVRLNLNEQFKKDFCAED